MSNSRLLTTILAVLPPAAALGLAPAAALEVGDPAPALTVARWWNADQPAKPDPDKGVQVVCFWATWSGPAVESLATLGKLQSEFADRDVRFVAISDEPAEVIARFTAERDDVTALRIAADDGGRSTADWMTACGEAALPHAFVVDTKGIIAWRGHPTGLRDVVDGVVKGTWVIQPPEPEPAAPEAVAENDQDDTDPPPAATETAEADDPAGTQDDAQQIDAEPRDSPGPMVTLLDLERRLGSAEQSGEWDRAVELIDAMLEQLDDPRITANLLGRKFNHQYEKMGSYSGAEHTAQRLLSLEDDEPGVLNSVAWTLLAAGDFESLDYRWPAIAHEAARRALRACDYENTSIIDTYARSLYMLGHVEHAITWQDRAVQRMRGLIEEARKEGANRRFLQRSQSSLRSLEVTLEYYREILAVRRDAEQ